MSFDYSPYFSDQDDSSGSDEYYNNDIFEMLNNIIDNEQYQIIQESNEIKRPPMDDSSEEELMECTNNQVFLSDDTINNENDLHLTISTIELQNHCDENITNPQISNGAISETKKTIRPAHSGRGDGFPLSKEEAEFKEKFFHVFLRGKKKKFTKKDLIQIHEKFIANDLCIKPMSRDAKRSIDRYFHDYISESKNIIDYVNMKRDLIIAEFPSLKKY